MTAQTKGVDVLAVMDEAAGKLVRSPNPAIAAYSAAVGEARTAIAELINAAKGMRAVTGGGSVCTVTESLAAYRRLDAALARVGGAS